MKRLLIDELDLNKGKGLRIACMTDNKLTEIIIDRGSIVGHIINGIVQNVVPDRFAFIDIGQEKNAFMNLHGRDIKQGRHIPVQVLKDATSQKGASVSDTLKFKGRFAILYRGHTREIGISHKITDKAERRRLHNLASSLLPDGYSCIMRTQSNSASALKEAIQSDFQHLAALSDEIHQTALYCPAPKILYRDDFIFNDLLTDDIEEIILTSKESISKNFLSDKRTRIWDGGTPLFDAFGVERQIMKALQRNVWLPCGGFITFDQVEACAVIDVNTGKHRGPVLKANIEAAKCIAEQIALRNLSGMIIVDFIDMPLQADKESLLTSFGEALQMDRIPASILGMTELGLVQLTRRKQREPLSRILQQPCPHCDGTGFVRRAR